MKNFKISLSLGTLLIAFALLFTQSAFTPFSKKSTTLKYRYIGSNEAGLNTQSNWQSISPTETPVPCEPGTELPCLVSFEDDQYSDIVDFYTTNPTATQMFSSNKVVNRKD